MVKWKYEDRELRELTKSIPIEFTPDNLTLKVKRGPRFAPKKYGIQIIPLEGKIEDVEHTGPKTGFHRSNSERCTFWYNKIRYEIFYEKRD